MTSSVAPGPIADRPRKRKGRSWIWAGLLTLIAVVGSFLLWRATSLGGLPRGIDPFDLRADGTVAIPDDENAFTFYRRATDHFQGHESDLSNQSVFNDWSAVDDRALKPLEANREALGLWFEGTKRHRAVYIQPRLFTYATILDVTQRLRSFTRLANLEAFRLQHRGDYAGAWAWIRGNLRSTRHSGQNGCTMERLVGISLYQRASGQAMVWADDPRVDAASLRKALDDVLAVEALTPRAGPIIRAEFFAAMNTLDDVKVRELMVDELAGPRITLVSGRAEHARRAALAFLVREPERSRRVVRHLIHNWLAACDLPPVERKRRVIVVDKVRFYGPPPGDAAALPAEELSRWHGSTRYAKSFTNLWSDFDSGEARDERNRADLIVHLADQLYRRERGKPPGSPRDLVGPYLKQLPDGYEPSAEPQPQGAPR